MGHPVLHSDPEAGFEQVIWSEQLEPFNPRFKDSYRSKGSHGQASLAHARHVFLEGCGLIGPDPLWQHHAQWCILETGFGLGLNFLATYHAWLKDPHRPTHLHYCAIEAHPVAVQDIDKSTQGLDELKALSQELQRHYWGLTPGFHRLTLGQGFVHLTLCIGDVQEMLVQLSTFFDSLYLDGFNPDNNPQMWNALTMKGVAARAKFGTKAATWCDNKDVREHLQTAGFVCERRPGLSPEEEMLSATFSPAWQAHLHGARPRVLPCRHDLGLPEQAPPLAAAPTQDSDVVIVGAGLAGATAAHALAMRGLKVLVLEMQDLPSTELMKDSLNAPPRALKRGAHGLPFGLFHPMNSRDDNLQSKMTRSGIRVLLDTLNSELGLQAGQDFKVCGVLEKKKPSKSKARHEALPLHPSLQTAWLTHWSRQALDNEVAFLGLSSGAADTSQALFHEKAGWVNVQAFLQALLKHPMITLKAQEEVTRIECDASDRPLSDIGSNRAQWRVHTTSSSKQGLDGYRTNHVILTTSLASPQLLQEALNITGPGANGAHDEIHQTLESWPLQAIKGQLNLGDMKALSAEHTGLPHFAVNGQSSWMGPLPTPTSHCGPPGLETSSSALPSALFCIGASYERECHWVENTTESQVSNAHKFKALLPGLEMPSQTPLFDWSGVRSTCHDRLPFVGPLSAKLPGLWVCTALGSRGLSLGAMLSRHLCALITGEPSPLPKRLIQAIGTQRFLKEQDGQRQVSP